MMEALATALILVPCAFFAAVICLWIINKRLERIKLSLDNHVKDDSSDDTENIDKKCS